MTKQLFPVDKRDAFSWQAYLSSALTLPDAQTRDRIKSLNSLIKKWLEEATDSFIYLPQEYSDPSRGDKMKPEEIYILDRWRIAESDFIVMNLDTPSFGVGQEAEIACSMGIPIVAFHYKGNLVSRIIRGIPSLFIGEGAVQPSEGVIAYEDLGGYLDLKGDLISSVKRLQKSIKPLPSTSAGPSFSMRLQRAITKSRKTVGQVAREAGFTEAFLKSLLHEYKFIESIFEPYELLKLCRLRNIPEERYLNPGLWVLKRLAETLDIRISALVGDEDIGRAWHEPLILLSRKGVSLEEFVAVADDADYLLMHQKAARNSSPDEVAEGILRLVESKRNGGSKK
jgi:hypothetical protein